MRIRDGRPAAAITFAAELRVLPLEQVRLLVAHIIFGVAENGCLIGFIEAAPEFSG